MFTPSELSLSPLLQPHTSHSSAPPQFNPTEPGWFEQLPQELGSCSTGRSSMTPQALPALGPGAAALVPPGRGASTAQESFPSVIQLDVENKELQGQ